MAFSYAWFFSLRSQKNAADNLKIVGFEGEIYEYKENYETEENGTNKTYKGFQDTQKFDDPEADTILSYFDECATIDFKIPTLLPNTKYLYLLKLRHNMETDINANFYINSYESYYGQKGTSSTQAPLKEDGSEVSLSEAINIYIYEKALKEKEYVEGLNSLVNYTDYTTYESFHTRTKMEDGFYKIDSNCATSMVEKDKGGNPLLTSVSIPVSTSTDQYYYVPIMFEFSDENDTYYKYTEGVSEKGEKIFYYEHNPSDGTSNAYRNLTFEIKEFEVTPYTKSTGNENNEDLQK